MIGRVAKTTGEAVGDIVGGYAAAGVILPPVAPVIVGAGGFVGSMAAGAIVEKGLDDQFQEMDISTARMLSGLENADKNPMLKQIVPENLQEKGENLALSRFSVWLRKKSRRKIAITRNTYYYP